MVWPRSLCLYGSRLQGRVRVPNTDHKPLKFYSEPWTSFLIKYTMCALTCPATQDIHEYWITLLCLCYQECVCGGAESLSVPAGLADVRRRLGGGLWVVRAAALHPEQRRSDPQHLLGFVRPHGCQVKRCSTQRLGVCAGSQWHLTGSDGIGGGDQIRVELSCWF